MHKNPSVASFNRVFRSDQSICLVRRPCISDRMLPSEDGLNPCDRRPRAGKTIVERDRRIGPRGVALDKSTNHGLAGFELSHHQTMLEPAQTVPPLRDHLELKFKERENPKSRHKLSIDRTPTVLNRTHAKIRETCQERWRTVKRPRKSAKIHTATAVTSIKTIVAIVKRKGSTFMVHG